ncbi:MAG: shikimate dehydrogenase [Thermodesulfobacteriota bacterium]|jgi:shikimate dehydrogenase|nr:shikimate dehydrogenase [Candidatus Dadabacteria bacterium]MCZ6865632.1 shikimate dehydrogenase [Candidatus Dadabacteria bacterium]
MGVKATTDIYGIFGHPVKHSLSPDMHNSAFNTLGLNSVYVAFDIDPESIEEAARAIRVMGIRGINITIPHKQTIIPYLDEVSPDAKLTGAVNTVKNENGKLLGYNTDVGGFLRAIREDLDFSPEGNTLFLIGAGGAARAVLSAFCMNGGAVVYITDIIKDKALELANQFKANFQNITIETVELDNQNLIEQKFNEADILVNASPAGMDGVGSLDIPLTSLNKNAVVYDLVYKPPDTNLLKEAKQLGHKASGGLSMLLYQGAESFEIWTGENAPVEIMKKALG